MNAKTFDKLMLPSRHVTEGSSRALARSYYPARTSAVTHAGGKAEVVCYADI